MLPEPSMIGSLEEVRAVVEGYREIGVSELVIPDFTLGNHPERLEVMDRFIEEIGSQFR